MNTARQIQGPIRAEPAASAGRAAEVDYAYQPIVSTTSLRVHAFEALARFPGDKDASEVVALIESAALHGAIREVESTLVTKAISKFMQFGAATSTTLFCNLDNRLYEDDSGASFEILEAIYASGLPPSNVCVEISEGMPIASERTFERLLESLARSNVRIALDDFGVGLSGLQRLLLIEPQYVKIDRCFIEDLAVSQRKQAIVSKLCGLAHALGFSTVAEGIEKERDFRVARELGCDFAQGYLISRPISRISELRLTYETATLNAKLQEVSPRIAELMSTIEPIKIDASLSEAVNKFNTLEGLIMLPVVDDHGFVKGALYEDDIRRLLMNEFGLALLANRSTDTRVEVLVRRCPIGDAYGRVEAIVDSYVSSEGGVGIVLAQDGRYVGYLSNNAVLRLAAERDVSEARDQNPLTHLPGNQSITRQIEWALTTNEDVTFAIIDFDHFKAFNDCYGFAAGDQSLQMFAELLRELNQNRGAFVGHIGGDDFFVLLKGDDSECVAQLTVLRDVFSRQAQSLYSPADRSVGGIRSVDRFGEERFFPLLSASVAALQLPLSRAHLSLEIIQRELARLKNSAKSSESGMAVGRLAECAPAMMNAELSQAFGAPSS